MTTQARELAGIISNAGDLLFDDDVTLQSDGAVLNFGADSDVTLTHVADTALLLNSTRRLQFGDSGTYIYQSADGVLNLTSDTEVEINATTLDINANVDISGNLVLGGNITIGDADSDAITINADLTSHLIPNATNTYDLGTASKEWRNAYFDGTVTSDAFAGPLTGNASTATALATARTIGGVSFDGTANIAVTLAATATALASGRTIGMTGDVVWTSPSFDGSGNVTAAGTIQTDAVDIAMLSASGTASSSTFLRGDNSWASAGTSWQAVVTSATTMVSGRGYFVNTTSAAITMTLPASPSIGDFIQIIDYAGTADTYNITVARNSQKIQGDSANLTVSTERAAFTLVYVDSTQGWLLTEK